MIKLRLAIIGNSAAGLAAAAAQRNLPASRKGGLVGLKTAYALKKRGLPRVVLVIKSRHLMVKQLDPEYCRPGGKTFSRKRPGTHFSKWHSLLPFGPVRVKTGFEALSPKRKLSFR